MGETPRAQAQRSAIGEVEPMQRIVGKNTSRPASWVRLQLRKLCAIGQVEPMQRCGISVPKAQKLCAQQGASPFKCEPSEAVSESQNLKRESKSLILSLELTQRADFAPRAYAALSHLRACQKYFFDTLSKQPVKESSRNSELFGIMGKKRTGGEKNGTVATG